MLTKIEAHLDILQRIELEIRVVKRRLEELETTRRMVLELRAAPVPDLSLLDSELAEPEFRHVRVVCTGAGRSLRSIERLPEAIETVLRYAGEPLGAREISERLVAGGYKGYTANDIDSLRGMVRATVSRDARFATEARGTYGLVEWIKARAWRTSSPRLPGGADAECKPAATVGAVAAGFHPQP
jgi:hypothetical protein